MLLLYLPQGIETLEQKFPQHIDRLRGRGRGTFIAFDGITPAKRDAIIGKLKQQGERAHEDKESMIHNTEGL